MDYIKENAYMITKMLLNQFGAAFLGLVLYLASSTGDNAFLIIAASVFSILFYVYLQYSVMWDLGARDIIRVNGKRASYRPANGFIIALIANIPNILIAVLVLIGHIFGSADGAFGYEWAGTLYVASKSVGVSWESMFSGFVQLYSPHNPVIFFLMLIPPLLASSVGYIFGMKNFRILSLIGINPKPKKK